MRPKNLTVSQLTGAIVRSVFEAGAASRSPVLDNLLCGIEIEAEEVEIDHDNLNLSGIGWTTHVDHSLRDGLEFVLSEPLAGNKLAWAVESLFNAQPEYLNYSANPRAGTHIHVNISDKKLDVAQAMFTLMYVIDRLVFEWAGDDRMWCSYCNSLNTLPAATIRSFLRNDEMPYGVDRYSLWPTRDNDRYYGFNVTSMFKYGTLEFRYFPTATSRDSLWNWLDFCQLVFAYADKLEVAEDESVAEHVLRDITSDPLAFMQKVFGDRPKVVDALCSGDSWVQYVSDAAEELQLLLSIDSDSAVEEVSMPGPAMSWEEAARADVVYIDEIFDQPVSATEWMAHTAPRPRPVRPSVEAVDFARPVRLSSTGSTSTPYFTNDSEEF